MDFQAYLGIGGIVVGLAMSMGEIARRQHAEALHSVGLSLLGALLLTVSVMEPGWTRITVLVGIFVLAMAMRLATSRLSRRQGS